MFTTKERQNTLARVRRKRAHFIRVKPHWLTAIKDTAVIIDSLEALVTLDLKGGQDAKEKKKATKDEC